MSAQDMAPQQLADTTKGAEIPGNWFALDEVLAAEKKVLKVDQGNALCISGGGIRSATFALGALQGLAELGLLEKFDYLSTVSGGGYIGSWLTAWKQRWGGLVNAKQPWRPEISFKVGEFVIAPDNRLQKVSKVIIPLTNTKVQITNKVLTITAKNALTKGIKLDCSGFQKAFFLNGLTLEVFSATSTEFTAKIDFADYVATPDKGTIIANSGSGKTGLTEPCWPAKSQAQVTDGTLVWTCQPQRENKAHYDPPVLIIDSNGNVQQLSISGTTGDALPQWKKAAGETTKDGEAQWVNMGPAPTVASQLRPSAFPPKTNPDPVHHLREYNNYLSPKLGFFSADTWTLVATVARNMLLNWMVFIPLLLCGLMVPRIVLSLARLGETYGDWYVPGMSEIFKLCEGYHILEALGLLFFALGIYNFMRYLPGLGKANHTQGQFLKYSLGPFYLAALALITLDAWFTGGDFTGDREYVSQMSFSTLWLFIGIANAAGYLAFAVFQRKALGNKWEELRKKREFKKWPRTKWVFSLLAGGILTSLSTATGAWLLTSQLFLGLSWPLYVTFALPLLFLAFGIAISIFVGVTSRALEDDDREWLARAGAWGLLSIVSWAGLSALSLLAPQLLLLGGKVVVSIYSAGGISALISTLAGLSSKTKAQPKSDGSSENKKSGLLDIAAKLAAPVFIAVFLASLGILINWMLWKLGWLDISWRWVNNSWSNHQAVLENTRWEVAVLLAVIFLSFGWVAAKFIDINKFSLQAMYRNRLIRAYLGASNGNPKINRFTGFDENDNLLMRDLDGSMKPFHIVNMALNLVSGKRLAWQQRKAASFTVSPLHCGNDELGYRPSSTYGGQGGLSLGTAVAISGAAASPNMGYHSSPAVTFIMTLFNARLGSWLGNPKQNKWQDEGPRSAFDSIIREAFGLTDESSPYVYLSDGGHFENLAVYEMVRRRCRCIVVLDGGCDPDPTTYEDLGNALRKIRIDQKVPIEFKSPFPVPGKTLEKRFALAEINYKAIDPSLENGYLIYIKPVFLETDQPDVTAYKKASPTFPHESTGNQWFNESQTESYRMLGLCSVLAVFSEQAPRAAGTPSEFGKDAIGHLKRAAAS